jgi:serine/threonine protein kinase
MTLAGQQLGPYRLVRLIGQGGMGEVYLAEDTRISRQVAIKVIRSNPESQASQQAERLFQREIKAIAQLNHPHILSVYDFGEQSDTNGSIIYMVMPYCAEGSLNDWLMKHGLALLDRRDVGRMIAQAASALQHAHDRNIIHRDVKPANFLVRTNADHPTYPDLLLVDFGIAKVLSTTSTVSQSVRGTFAYMAPEQWSSDVVAATDQYALAMMTYQLLTSQLPFQGRSEQMMYQHLTVIPKPPSHINTSLSPAIDQVILHALAKQADQRFPTIRHFATALQQAIDYVDVRATLTITAEEALQGMSHTIILSDKQQMTVMIPPRAQNGQELRLPDQGLPYYDGGPRGCLLLTLSTVQTDHLPVPVKIDEQNELTVRSPRPISPIEPVSDKFDQQRSPTTTDANRSMDETVVSPQIQEMTLPAYPSHSSGAMQLGTVIDHHNKPLRERIAPLVTVIGHRNKPLGHRITLLATVALLLIISGVLTTMLTPNMTVTTSTDATVTALYQKLTTIRAKNPDPYPPAGTLAFADQLSGPQQWQEKSYKNFGGICKFVNDAYQISQSQLNKSYPCDENDPYSNFAFEVKMTINQGNCGGMMIRYDSKKTGKGYSFLICQNGYYYFYKYTPYNNASNAKTLASGSSLAIHQGNQSNLIAVVANGSAFDLYVNSQKIASVSDSSYYSEGEIGLLAYAVNNVTTVTYQDARLWEIPKNKA